MAGAAAEQQDAADEPRREWRLAADLGVSRTAQQSMTVRLVISIVAATALTLPSGCHPVRETKKSVTTEHAVLVHLRLSDAHFGTRQEMDAIHALSERLEAKILEAKAGEFDGDEFGQRECTLYMYGPDADALFVAIERELRASPLSRGGWVIKRYGAAEDRSAKELRINLDAG